MGAAASVAVEGEAKPITKTQMLKNMVTVNDLTNFFERGEGLLWLWSPAVSALRTHFLDLDVREVPAQGTAALHVEHTLNLALWVFERSHGCIISLGPQGLLPPSCRLPWHPLLFLSGYIL